MSHKIYRLVTGLFLALVMIIIVTGPRPASAAGPWYVAPAGDDNNDCLSPSTACATINSAINKASSGDTINVAVGTYTSTGSEVLLIDKDITLSGGWDETFTTQTGMSTIDGESVRRGVAVNTNVIATLESFTIQNGNKDSEGGGGVFNNGILTLNHVLIADNVGGVGQGGGILNTQTGTVNLNHTTITRNGNQDLCNGTAISNQGTITANNSTITENRVERIFCGIGSAVINFTGSDYRGTITLNNTTVSNNSPGGGIYNYGNLSLNNSTVSNNTGDNSTGPGGIYNSIDSILTLSNSTISGNTTSGAGGGIFNISSGTVTMQNTIVAGNIAGNNGPDCSGIIGSSGFNLIGDVTNCDFTAATGDLTNVDAKLGFLIGSPAYHPLLSDSPAIDAGNPAGCTDQDGNPLNTDQRGVARVGICDIGAYEFTTPGAVTDLFILSGDAQHTITTLPFPIPFQVAAVDNLGSPVEGATIDFTAPDSGPSGTFADSGTNSTSVATDTNGVAAAAIFTANDQAGNYTVSASTTGASPVNFSLEQVDRPANDNFADAEVIAALPFSDSVDVTNATKEPGEPSYCGSGPEGQSLWYSFTPVTNSVVGADMEGSSFPNGNLTIFRATGPGFEGLAFVGNGCFGRSLTFNAQAGTTYYIQAERSSTSSGELHLNLQEIPAPANDNFADAEVIASLPFSATADTTGATTETGEPQGCGFFAFRSVWYSFTPTENMVIRVSTTQGTVSGVVSLFLASGPAISDLTSLACTFSNTNVQVEAGKTYYLRVDTFGEPAGAVQFSLEQILPPANDNFADAVAITSLPFNASVDNTNATIEPGEPQACSSLFRSAWYSFVPTENMALRVGVNSPFGGIVNVFLASGPAISDLTSLTCAFSGRPVNFQVEAGKTYYLQVDSFGQGDVLQISLEQILPPANDDFADAAAITSLPFAATVDNTDATTESGEPQVCGSHFRTVWYSFTATENMSVRVDMAGSAVQTGVGLYVASGPAISDLTSLTCSFGSTNFQVEAGKTYYLQVDTFGESGVLQVSLEQIFPPANDDFASADAINALPFNITVDNTDATIEPGEDTGCASQFRSLWYSFSPTENIQVRMNTFGSTAPGNISIYLASGPSISDLTFLTCTTGASSAKLMLEAGNTYYLRVDSYGQAGDIQVNLEELVPPANDNFASAEVVATLPFSTTVDISDATIQPDEPQNCYSMDSTVWYSFAPTETMVLRADVLGSSISGNVNIYASSGTGFSDLQFVNCSGPTDSPSFVAEAGQTYYFQVGSAFGESGTVTVNLRQAIAPANDNFASAEAIASLPFGATIDITDATNEPDEPQFCNFMPDTVWYSFTATETKKLVIDTANSSISANVNVYHATGPGFADLQFVQCSAFGASAFLAEAGETYYFQAGGLGQAGSIQFNLSEAATIAGRVIDAVTGSPLPGDVEPFATVQLFRICGEGCREFVNSQSTDSEGRFVFDSYHFGGPLSAGSYQIEALAQFYHFRQFGPFELSSTHLDVGDLPLDPPSVIRGRAVDAVTGAPLPDASAILRRCDSNGCLELVNSQNTDVDGLFHFNSDFSGFPLSAGTYELEISAILHETLRIEVTIGAGENRDLGDLLIQLIAPIGSIRGRLVDAVTRRPISGTFAPVVELYQCDQASCSFVNSLVPDNEGRFRFETDFAGNHLTTGSYQILAHANQYQSAQTAIFEVGANVYQTVGDIRLTSFPVRFSALQPCADIPASGGSCIFRVKVTNGTNRTLKGKTWSMADAGLPGSFAGFTRFQVNDLQDLDLGRGGSQFFRFRINVPANDSPIGSFICTRVFVGEGARALFNTIGYSELFCVVRNASGFAITSPQDILSGGQENTNLASTATEIEPNNSCQEAQDAGLVSGPFVMDGALDSSQAPDIDFFRFTGTAGQSFTIDHEGAATGKGTLSDPLLGFFDSNCNLIALNDDSSSLNSHLEIVVPDDGVFIMAATTYPDFGFTGGGLGSYQLTVAPIQYIGSISGIVTDALTGNPLRGDVVPFAFVNLIHCDAFGCFTVNSQNAGSDGRFHFDSDFNGSPLRVGNYFVAAFADQYQAAQTEMFTVGEGEDYDAGDIALNSYPIRFSNTQTCTVPAQGGLCNFSVKVTNGSATRFSGRAWSIIDGFDLGSFANITQFQADTARDINLDPGTSVVLRFRFYVRGSVNNGAIICATAFVGQNPRPFFHTAGQSVLFCFVKGINGFTLMSETEIQAQMQRMSLPELTPMDVQTLPRK